MATATEEDPIIPQGVTLRAFDDAKAARKAIYDGTLDALSKRFPLENKNYRLELSNVRFTGPQEFTLAQQKAALLGDKQLHTPVSGHFKLFRKSDNSLVDEKDEVVMNVPYYTDRGTVINNGSEYTIANQLRLRPGVYTRVRRSGDVETQFNVKPGTGRGFRLRMEPSTGVVTVNVGHANMPLYPLLRTLGVTDQQMIKAWGADVAHANAAKADSIAGRSAVDKLYQAFAGYNATAQDLVSKERYLADTLPKFRLDPGVTSRTLGIAAEGITPDVLLRAASKMFNVNRGEEKADDRDNPGFANVFGIDDLYRERIEKDAGKLSRNIMMKISRAGSLKPVGRAAFSGWHDELLHGSGLAMPGDNSNPMALEEQMLRVTRMGEGGIGSADVVTDEARQVNSGNLNFIDPVAGPENEKIGVDARLGVHTRKGSDGKLYSLFVNSRGKKEYVACDTAADSVIGFPGSDPKAPTVPAMKNGQVQMVQRSEVDYFMPDTAGMFSANINLNPMPTAVQGGRQFYGAKFWGQYLPAAKGEVPLVDSLMPDGKMTWSEYYGRKLGTLKSPAEGIVSKVTDKGVTVTGKDGKKHFVETVVDFPFNGLTGLTYTPTVKVGDKVGDGDMVAASNFVDQKTGGLAMGTNLKMAWLPYKGFSYEDAICISESAAKRLATDRLYGFESDPRDGSELGLSKYMSSFPKKFTKEQFATLDDNGVVKEGTVLNKGDPISVAVGPKLLTAEDANLGKLSKVLRGAFTDKSQVWEHDFPATVVSSTVFRGRAKVNVKAAPPMGVADKLSPRFALKGVVGQIIPDDKMPRDAVTNEPYDILMNPLGIPSRVAPGQLIETALGKLAKATGKPMRIPQDPPPEGWAQWASDQLKAAGISPTTDVFDPETGRTLHGIGDGYVYFHAMHHLADKKLSAKGGSGGYTADLQPAKGGHEGAKRVSGLDVYALISHGATENLKDTVTIRGTKNEDYWKAVRSGGPLPQPQVPFVYKKAMNLLRAGGINVVEGQRSTDILPMTDKDTEKLTGGRIITNSKMLDDDLKELKGGLFDPFMTGGAGNQDRWAAIALPEPIPNPVMEEPVRRVLGMTGKKLQAVISGEEQLDGLTGGKALQKALSSIDVDKEIERQRDIARKARGSKRDDAVKIIGYLSGCKKQGLTPKDWMISKVPVIPPMFRPVAKIGDTALISDINELYRDVIESSDAFNELKKDVPDSGLTDERLNVYNAVKAAYGLGEAISPEGQAKKLKGAIRQVIGNSPKTGLFQAKTISKAVDGVGRAVISPEPNYDMDQCGIPEETAWKLYKDYVIRGLSRRGYPQERATQLVDEKAKVAKDILLEEMGRRPVILDRAPTWHKFNFMAFWPSLVEGNTMRMNPVVEKAFTADHDGNCIIGSTKLIIRVVIPSGLRKIIHSGSRQDFIKFTSDNADDIWYTTLIMKVIAKSEVVMRDAEGVVAVVCIKDIPYIEGTKRKDRNGADMYDVPEGLQILTTSTDGKGVRWSPFTTLTIENGCSLRHVVTARGRDVVVSDNESVAVYDNDAGLLKVKPDDIGNRLVPVAMGIPESAGSDLSFKHGWLVGMFLSDGWLSNGRVFVSKRSSRARARIVQYLADISGDAGLAQAALTQIAVHDAESNYGISGESYKLSIPEKLVPSRVINLFKACYELDWADRTSTSEDRACLHKLVPVELLSAPEQVKLGVLCGLLDGDGSFVVQERKGKSQVRATYCTSSPHLRDTVTLLLSGLGIASSVTSTHVKEGRAQTHDSYTLSISTNGLAKYAGVMDLAEDKSAELRMLTELRPSQTDIVPVSYAVLDLATKHFSAEFGISRGALFTRKTEAVSAAWKYTGLSRTAAASVVSMLESASLEDSDRALVHKLRLLVDDETTRWERVKTVEQAPTETVYDIAVPETKVFALANGLVIYDTMNFHVPSSDKAVEEAKEKMLPSKNLFSTTDLKSPRYVPMMEMTLGLARLTAPQSSKKPQVFITSQDAIRAYRRGEIGANDPVSILKP